MKVNRADATFFVNEIRQQMLNSGVTYIDHAIDRFAPVMSPAMRAAVRHGIAHGCNTLGFREMTYNAEDTH